MSNTEQAPLQGLEALKNVVLDDATATPTNEPVEVVKSTLPMVREKKIDALGRAYGTGKRKAAVARVWIKPGKGTVTVNGRLASDYFASAVREMVIAQPFDATNTKGHFDVFCTVKGGGLSGQAGAVKHGISKALQLYDPSLRGALKAAGFLTRDSRVVERKKYGKRKARRSFQFSKR